MKNLINKIEIEIHCPGEEHALELRQNFSLTFQRQIERSIDEVCSKYSLESENIKIDKLELDLGVFNANSFNNTFANVFAKHFEECLLQKLREISPEEKKDSVKKGNLELLRFFIHNGRLPWWVDNAVTDLSEVVDQVILYDFKAFVDFLFENRFNEKQWKRVAYQWGDEVVKKIAVSYEELDQSVGQLTDWLISFQHHFKRPAESQDMTINVVRVVVENAAQIFRNPSSQSILQNLLIRNIPKFFKEYEPAETLHLHAFINSFFSTMDTGDSGAKPEHPRLPDAPVNDEKHFARQGGIVLLAQYLNAFFKNLNYLQGSHWQDRECQYQAIHLLRFLSTGECESPEYNLILEKLVCGLPIDEPIPLAELTAPEVAEAEALLSSVIEHWDALKNTSIQGLRDSFLKRDCIITKKDGNWRVQVERKTVDVLLDKIPWGYSVIVLPWNDYLIYVEW
jgi:hypothetical protein